MSEETNGIYSSETYSSVTKTIVRSDEKNDTRIVTTTYDNYSSSNEVDSDDSRSERSTCERYCSRSEIKSGLGAKLGSGQRMDRADEIRFLALSRAALPPARGSEFAAGIDLRSAYDYNLPSRGHALVATDLRVILPMGTYGRLASRSGLAWNNLIDVRAGVIDADYTGNVKVLLHNLHPTETFSVKRGDRVAQLICEKICLPDISFVDFDDGNVARREESTNVEVGGEGKSSSRRQRYAQGFGSSGII